MIWFGGLLDGAVAVARRIPLGLLLRGLALALAAWWAYGAGVDAERVRWVVKQAQAEAVARVQTEFNRKEEARRWAAQQGALNAKEQELADARRDAADALDAGGRLRAEIGRVTASCRPGGDPAPAGRSAPTPAALDMLADVQRRLDAATEGIARHADEAGAAGRACQRSYDALTGSFDE